MNQLLPSVVQALVTPPVNLTGRQAQRLSNKRTSRLTGTVPDAHCVVIATAPCGYRYNPTDG
jgi:hypothetical protein